MKIPDGLELWVDERAASNNSWGMQANRKVTVVLGIRSMFINLANSTKFVAKVETVHGSSKQSNFYLSGAIRAQQLTRDYSKFMSALNLSDKELDEFPSKIEDYQTRMMIIKMGG